MKIGTLIHIEYEENQSSEVRKYRCKIIEKNNQGLIIDYPINVNTNKTSFLPIGSTILVTYVSKDKAVYQFRSIILERVNMKIPALLIKLPEKKKIKRIQRREFVRVESAIDVAIHSLTKKFVPFTTVTEDISGGGLSFIIPERDILTIGEYIQVFIVLPMNNIDSYYISVEAKVVFIKSLKSNINITSVKFTKITKIDQQLIIRYCFEKQRQARQKELQ